VSVKVAIQVNQVEAQLLPEKYVLLQVEVLPFKTTQVRSLKYRTSKLFT